jgi:hypothetical protein
MRLVEFMLRFGLSLLPSSGVKGVHGLILEFNCGLCSEAENSF